MIHDLGNGMRICRSPMGGGEECLQFLGTGSYTALPEAIDTLELKARGLRKTPEPEFPAVMALLERYTTARNRRNALLTLWWHEAVGALKAGEPDTEAQAVEDQICQAQGEIRQILLQLSHREWKEDPPDTRTEMGQ